MDDSKKRRSFQINNKDILIKGAGYSPDLLQRRSKEKYEIEFQYIKHMNLNTVRLSGKMEDKILVPDVDITVDFHIRHRDFGEK